MGGSQNGAKPLPPTIPGAKWFQKADPGLFSATKSVVCIVLRTEEVEAAKRERYRAHLSELDPNIATEQGISDAKLELDQLGMPAID